MNLKPSLKQGDPGSNAVQGHNKSFLNAFGLFSDDSADSDSDEDRGAKGGDDKRPTEKPTSWVIPGAVAPASANHPIWYQNPHHQSANGKRIVKSPGAGGWREHIRKAQEKKAETIRSQSVLNSSNSPRSPKSPKSPRSALKVRSPRLVGDASGLAPAVAQTKDDEALEDRLKREQAERKAARAWQKVKAKRMKEVDSAADKGGKDACAATDARGGEEGEDEHGAAAAKEVTVRSPKKKRPVSMAPLTIPPPAPDKGVTTHEGGTVPAAVETSPSDTSLRAPKESAHVPEVSAQPVAADHINGSVDEVVRGDHGGDSNGDYPAPPQHIESQKWLDSESESDDDGSGDGKSEVNGIPLIQLSSLGSPKRLPGLGERRRG